MAIKGCSMCRGPMTVLQVFQEKMLQALDETGLETESFKKLRSATDLPFRATKKTARHSMQYGQSSSPSEASVSDAH